VHSRAAKRASSPSIDTDKSLKNVKLPTESKSHRPSILAVHQSAGVSKKSKHGRKSVLSAKAKRRQERGMDRAEVVMDKIEKKVEKSKGKARTVQERAKAWEDLNKNVLATKAQTGGSLEKENLDDEDDMLNDAEISDATAGELPVAAQSIPLPEPIEDDNEIL
jgi:hypothetical protein